MSYSGKWYDNKLDRLVDALVYTYKALLLYGWVLLAAIYSLCLWFAILINRYIERERLKKKRLA